MKSHLTLALLLLLAISASTKAQSNHYTKAELEKSPLWISMMEDTLTNFFEAQHAFQTYWSIRPQPIEEDEILGHTELKEAERKSWLQKIFFAKKEQREKEAELYSFEYKKFKYWERATQPYVQDDGSILTPAQRIAIWKEQHTK